MKLLKNQPIRLPGLSLDFARDGEPFGRLRATSSVEWLIEPKARVMLRVNTALRCPEPVDGSGVFHPDLIFGTWRRRTYQWIGEGGWGS
jgi:hypothetical protein